MIWANEYSSPASNVLNLDEWRQQSHAVSPWKKQAENRLLNLAAENGEDIELIGQSNLLYAQKFLAALPLDIDAPCITYNEDGGILFEWYKKDRSQEPTMFSVIIKDDVGFIYSVLKSGVSPSQGVLNFSDVSLDMLIPQIRKLFGILSNATRFGT